MAAPSESSNAGLGLQQRRPHALGERFISILLMTAAALSVVTTFAIVLSLAGDTVAFFREVSVIEYLTGTLWTPLFSNPRFGIWPLITATFMTSAIAMLVAVPFGLAIAVYLSEFASLRARSLIKPLLEVLAGIPTVVYGYFALTAVTPFLRGFIPEIKSFNSLSAGLVMGVMIIPIVASLTEDAFNAVPRGLREGAYGLGAMRHEVALRVVFPAALSGVAAALLLALSRAVGETMIVALAAGQNPTFTLDPLVPVSTMTAYIVQVSLGDTPYGSIGYKTIFAVGATLFIITFAINFGSTLIVRRFRERYD
ncbi:MAG: phosphate ABC transporter permease subunit PstC [Chloroflexi bacterium]|uniref:Phosphate transport system permease protein n=1 Tax=Candidatus Thermofonsia Clade 3 bacterium TaxID=2364212 RepID=A0A2M8QAJ4_9CHLR|nr:phosphate ABC transporter permease subunit PstC [Candidatus Roseilinea sp. NK_OTU-006]PJF46827.1 MAG: phosphate ABC transporter permease subunit PstC [Candidatus Thermofonsia Clade 3 bacterium]RMG65690.1 MAG: phosphate ABC transporter permease subunit PstC [Chloroflexota bacterium]